ncbi:unnamed protein product [Cyclocybe aegerita]|uniref:Rpa49 subunit specific to nuclear RNA polymerase I n=1 Tax=Cyclocybe aegerita TaxID=1973307 RepID=A0A8S0WYL8_CYCAE|nr:unnamed protein product [Cyclocybe aegerita]
MSTEKVVSKKRKRDESLEARFELAGSGSGRVGPVLVSFPALEPPSSTAFKCYAQKRAKTAKDAPDEDDMLVAGETPAVEFVSNEIESRKVAAAGCRYLLAVRSKKTNTISIFPSAKTPHILAHTVKALKSIPSSAAPSKVQYLEAKTALGETFGTKKQKASIRAQERNRIDVSAMEGVMSYVMDSIEKGAGNLLTTEDTKEAADKNRLIPPFSATATDPADIYPLHNIIPEAEWKALSVSAFDVAETDKDKIALLAYRKSTWINDRLKALVNTEGKTKKRNLKILLYISAMLSFRQATFLKGLDRDNLYERLAAVPTIVVDSLLSRFAETARASSSYQATSTTKTNLLTHILALCLKVDNYATNTKVIAHDLSMPVTEVNQLFKSLGCKITKLGERERARLGLAGSSAEEKHDVLNAPVEFPKPRLKRK